MLDNKEFALRVKKIMDYYQLSASVFADKIKVQRSSISHLISGRNKPSLDFVLKVIGEFKEVDLYWLLIGKGQFPHNNKSANSPSTPLDFNLEKRDSPNKEKKDTFKKTQEIEKIVMFYKDGTFKQYLK